MRVHIIGVEVQQNPCHCLQPFRFLIQFECNEALEDDLEWKLTFVGSSDSDQYDQELESLLVGPVAIGMNQFVFEAPHPDFSRIPQDDVLGVTVVLLTCSYRDREFLRIGYYVNSDYDNEEMQQNPPEQLDFSHIQRSILSDKPRITQFAIDWTAPQADANVAMAPAAAVAAAPQM